jgi:futalosine hydrolase
VLIITAVDAERDAVIRGLGHDSRFEVMIGGVGPVAAAVSTAMALAQSRCDWVISAGIGGGFAPLAPVGSIVIASRTVAADFGAETPDGFMSIEELGFGSSEILTDDKLSSKWVKALCEVGQQVHYGPIVTVNTATGTALTAEQIAARIKGAAAEGMEGFGVAAAASKLNVPFIEIRSISNAVGPRNRAAWRIGEALAALERASTILPEVIS